MKRPLQTIILKDSNPLSAVSERDAIKQLNEKKAKARGFAQDAAEVAEGDKPAEIASNDATSAEPEVEAEPDSQADTAPVTEEVVADAAPAAEPEAPAQDAATESAIKALSQMVDSLKTQIESLESTKSDQSQQLSSLQESLQQAQTQLADANEKVTKFTEVFDTMGNPNPVDQSDKFANVNVQTGRGIAQDTAAEFVSLLEDSATTPQVHYMNPNTGEILLQRDTRNLQSFYRENRDQLRRDMEKYAKDNGLLRGSRVFSGSDAATAKADIPEGFLVYLSVMMRETHLPKYIYWQFPNTKVELGKGPGDTIRVAKWNYLSDPTNVADYELTPGVRTVADDGNVTEDSVTLTLKEYGRGKLAATAPLSVPEFIAAYSMLDIEAAIRTRLGQNYLAFDDLALRSLLFDTTKVVYNNANRVTYTVGDLAANDIGTMTREYLPYLYAEMATLQIPTYDNGRYALVTHPRAWAQIKEGLAEKERFMSAEDIADVTEVLRLASGGELGKVSGYVGTVDGFMIFVQNAHSVGAAGTQGVQTETINAVATTTRSSLAFGRNTIAKADGMPAEIRPDKNDDFGRLKRYIWLAHSSYGYLDVDAALGSGQQTRVLEVRTLDNAI